MILENFLFCYNIILLDNRINYRIDCIILMLFKEMIKIKNNNYKIEIEKLNIIIEDNFYSVESKEKFIKEQKINEKTIEFLKEFYEKYIDLKVKFTETINDYKLYDELLKYISEQCGYSYKLSRDFHIYQII